MSTQIEEDVKTLAAHRASGEKKEIDSPHQALEEKKKKKLLSQIAAMESSLSASSSSSSSPS
jgi:hypothetical protein